MNRRDLEVLHESVDLAVDAALLAVKKELAVADALLVVKKELLVLIISYLLTDMPRLFFNYFILCLCLSLA